LKLQPLRIAILSIHSSPIGELGTKDTGGMSVYTREIAQELGSRGHQVDIYTRLPDPTCDPIIHLYENVRLIYLNGGNRGLKNKLELFPHLEVFFKELDNHKIQENLQYDLVHSHYWLSGELGRLAQHYWKVPHIIMFHTLGVAKNMTGVGDKEPRLRIDTENKLVNTCQRILAATEIEREQLVRYYGASPDKIRVVSCGVNLDLFHPKDKIEARKDLGFVPDESIVLYVGRFDPVKGIDRLLTAMSHLNNHHRIRLIIIGGDGEGTPESRHLKRIADKLGIQEVVTFVGRVPQEELPPYYCAADVLGVPSHYESFGLVGLESLACGTPVVATPVGAMERILREGETGRIVNDASPFSLAKAIEEFIAVPGNNGLSPHAIRTSILDYSWENVTSSIINEYAVVFNLFRNRQSGTEMPSRVNR